MSGEPTWIRVRPSGPRACSSLPSFLALELRTSVMASGDLVVRRLGTIVWLVTGSVVVGAFLLAVAAVGRSGGLALQLTGVAAVAGVLALVLSLARR
jgi:hypothetical protein